MNINLKKQRRGYPQVKTQSTGKILISYSGFSAPEIQVKKNPGSEKSYPNSVYFWAPEFDLRNL